MNNILAMVQGTIGSYDNCCLELDMEGDCCLARCQKQSVRLVYRNLRYQHSWLV